MQTRTAAIGEREPGSRQEVAWQMLALGTQDAHDCRPREDERRPSPVLKSRHKGTQTPGPHRDSAWNRPKGSAVTRHVCLGERSGWDGRYCDQEALFVSRRFLLGRLSQSATQAKTPGSKLSCPSWLPSPPGKVKEAKMSILS